MDRLDLCAHRRFHAKSTVSIKHDAVEAGVGLNHV